MYKIYMYKDDVEKLAYNDITPELTQTKLIDPKLSMEDNKAGSFTCKIPQGNAVYDFVEPMTVTVRILRDDEWLWSGRILTIKKDFWLNKEITVEGCLSYLNDTALPQRKWTNVNIRTFIQDIIDIHNDHAPGNRRIAIESSAITIYTNSGSPIGLNDYISNGESPLKHLTTLVEDWGLHIRFREVHPAIMPYDAPGGVLTLDILNDSALPSSTQSIDFGKNLLDYADETDWSDLITVVHPYGKELETHTITGDEDYPDRLTIKGKTPSAGAIYEVVDQEYLANKEAVRKFGRIEETVEWSEVDDATTLMKLSELYLSDYQYSNIKLTLKVVDLHYLMNTTPAFKFLSKVYCKSKPHNLGDSFLIDKMEIPLDKPENTQFTFSRCTMGYYTSDRPDQGYGRGIISEMSVNTQTFSRANLLNQAKRNAINMIMSNTSGYVTLNMDSTNDHVESITITEQQTKETSETMWIWNHRGLGFLTRDSTLTPWPDADDATLALTNDGHIVANFITAGVLQVASTDGHGGSDVLFSADMEHNTVHIAGFTVKGDALWSGSKNSLTSTNPGVFLGCYEDSNNRGGFSTSTNTSYLTITENYLCGGKYIGSGGIQNVQEEGYIDFITNGIRIAADHALCFCIPRLLINDNYQSRSGSSYENSVGFNGSRSFTVGNQTVTLTFVHGFCTGFTIVNQDENPIELGD